MNFGKLWDDLAHAYQKDIIDTGRETQFLVLVAYTITIVTVRIIVHVIRRGGPIHNVSVRGVHIHHMVPGIILLLISGYLGLALELETGRRIIAILFGIGAGLTLDEFALWTSFADVYWSEQGRKSVHAMLIVGGMAGLVFMGGRLWTDLWHAISGLF